MTSEKILAEAASFRQRIAVITGASRGIGRAAAIRFAQEGYQLALCCRHQQGLLEDLSRQLIQDYHVDCITFCGDMGSYADAERFIQLAQTRFGQVDVLVNNAGISYIGLLTDMSPDEWQDVIRTNLTSVFNCCRTVIPGMVHRKTGRIINISSVWGCVGASCEAAYSASKGGVNALTQALAKELAPSGISVNAAAFGTIDTEMNLFLSEDDRLELTEEIPAGRFASPEEAADLIFKISQAPSYMTGQIIKMDGGWI